MTRLWVMIRSAIGGGTRYWLSGLAATHISDTFPIGTLIINVTGSFIIGFFGALTGPDGRIFVRLTCGPMGFGHSSRLHTTKILRLSEDLPLIIGIVDSEERIRVFLPRLDSMMGSGLVTLEKVQVLQYGAGSGSAPI